MNKRIVIVDFEGDELFTGESTLAEEKEEEAPPTLRSRKDSGVFPRSQRSGSFYDDTEKRSA